MPVSRAPTGGAADDEVGAIIVAAGSSTRMDGVDKVLVPLMGLPLVAHSLRVFNSSPLVGSIVLVMSAANLDAGRRLVEEHGWAKVMDVCRGGIPDS